MNPFDASSCSSTFTAMNNGSFPQFQQQLVQQQQAQHIQQPQAPQQMQQFLQFTPQVYQQDLMSQSGYQQEVYQPEFIKQETLNQNFQQPVYQDVPQQLVFKPQQFQPMSAPVFYQQQQQQPTFVQPNVFVSPIRYAPLSSVVSDPRLLQPQEKVTRYSPLTTQHPSNYVHARLSPPPPNTTVRRDMASSGENSPRTSLMYTTVDRSRHFSPDFPRSFSNDRTVFSQRADSPDFGYDLSYRSVKGTRPSLSEDSDYEDRPYSAPLKAARKVIPDKDVLHTGEYTGKMEFETLDEAIDTMMAWADSQNVVLRKGSGNNKTMRDGSRKKQVLVCQCSGKYRSCSYSPKGGSSNSSCDEPQRVGSPKPHSKRKSKKTECPFRINLNFQTKTGRWNITKIVLEHNHP
ncbi:hypothetical protein EIN_026830 [Entamoeba invadens IP1]|uniref:hypothetical protein n=1 Tax=Entamoeba invadens IP1 TaxID=370355 RepID=UPI0002C3E471|nr:hypothetical protein EIN_026830 [Entamoeba invadens IP1]ELP90804.1 hypothetical protein EIN_026830 [Entamoeba invadens IP1]|eukprot:XP_004257575.1 hypothetical protein EIN_026830 [Entamoeba invadens IP1]